LARVFPLFSHILLLRLRSSDKLRRGTPLVDMSDTPFDTAMAAHQAISPPTNVFMFFFIKNALALILRGASLVLACTQGHHVT
jgi:hypothetical protein